MSGHGDRGRLSLLLASSSVAALLIGGGAPPAYAACANYTNTTAPGCTNAATITGIAINNSTVTSSITNTGTISTNGVVLSNASTITGQINNNGGTIVGGITLSDSSSKILTGASNAIINEGGAFSGGIHNAGTIAATSRTAITNAFGTFSGGISNSGTISGQRAIILSSNHGGPSDVFTGGIVNAAGGAIIAGNGGSAGAITTQSELSTFQGGIVNAGLISSGAEFNIQIGATTFLGGITNSGTISGAHITAIGLRGSTFSGNIVNSAGGLISAAAPFLSTLVGIQVRYSTFSGAITNAGTISTGNVVGIGIELHQVVQFGSNSAGGGIVNSGAITAGGGGILVGGSASGGSVTLSTFAGGITNSGTISAGGTYANNAGRTVNGNGIFVGGTAFTGGTLTVASFAGGIVNSSGGLISAAGNGIQVGGLAGKFFGGIYGAGHSSSAAYNIVSFGGGISNAGTILAGKAGILVGGTATAASSAAISTFSGNISNSGTITGATGIKVTANVTFSGSAIVNSGIITGTGGTAIDVSAATSPVTIDQTAGTIAGAIKLSAKADVLNISGGVINGNIVGQGSTNTINFTLGAGAFTYGNNFTGINQVNINSGSVILNGANSATNVDVFGGTLAGTGSIDPTTVTIHSGGAFAPGTPGVPGTAMTITGNLAFQSGALYLVQVSPTAATMANVSGTATLGGNVLAAFASGSYVQKQYDILHAGAVSGSFAALGTTNLPTGFSASLSYSGSDVFLNLKPGLSTAGLNGNQANVANALQNFFNGGGTLPSGFVNVFGLSGPNLANALTLLDGEAATDGEKGAFQLMNEFLTMMLDPFVTGRSGTDGSTANTFAPEQQANFPPDIALAYAGMLKAPPKLTFDQRWTAWGSGFGGYNKTNGDPVTGSNNVTARDYGFAAGMDYHFSPDTLAGFALAGGGTNWGLAQGLGGGRSDAFQAGVYGKTFMGPAYVAAALAFTNHWMTTNRIAFAGDQLDARFNAQSYGARLETGYRYALSPPSTASGGGLGWGLGVTPYAALQAQSFHTPRYSETDLTGGGFGLSYNAMTATDTRSELGARVDDLMMLNGMPLTLRARAAWAHDWITNPSADAVFQQLPGASFIVNGATPPKNSALASAGAELHMTAHWSLAAKFDGEFAAGSQTYSGTGTLRYTW